jgi:hypothetical protein
MRTLTIRTAAVVGLLLMSSTLAAARPAGASGAQDGAAVRGVVVAGDGRTPVASARVVYEDAAGGLHSTVTAGDGSFAFGPGVRPGGIVTVSARGFVTTRVGVPSSGSESLAVRLEAPAVVMGRVFDAASRRAVPAVVNVMVENPASFVSASDMADEGAFAISDLPAGPATLVAAHAAGYAPAAVETRLVAGETRTVALGLQLEAVIEGVVQREPASPVGGVELWVEYPELLPGADLLAGYVGGQTGTDPDGTFRLTGLVPGTPFVLYLETENGASTRLQFDAVIQGTLRRGVVITIP